VPTAYKTMQEIVYDTIREAIQIGRYTPGQRLIADELAQELGTSRMPVREALRRLEVSAQEIVEIYHIRAVLEGLAARLAASLLPSAGIDRLNALIEEMEEAAATGPDLDHVLRSNREFHIAIWQAAHAPRLQEILENLYDASHRFRNISIALPGRLTQIFQEHRQIVQALAAGDSAAAERFANEHHENTAQRLLTELEKTKEKEKGV
jgi:DNA-binding GntR family transcriptional regulator